MMTDRFPIELRQHLLAAADELPADGSYAAIVEDVAATTQRRAALAWLTWFPRRMGPFPSAAVRYGLIAIALIIATVAALAFAGQQPRRPDDLGIFEPVAGRILSGVWTTDPIAIDPNAPDSSTRLEMGSDMVLALGWSLDGRELLFLDRDPTDQSFPYDSHVFILHADGTRTQVRPEPVGAAAISPDGSQVAYAPESGGLYVVDADGGQPFGSPRRDRPRPSRPMGRRSHISRRRQAGVASRRGACTSGSWRRTARARRRSWPTSRRWTRVSSG